MKELHLLHGNRPFAICAAANIGMEQPGTLLLDEDIAIKLHFPIRQIQYNRFALRGNKKTRSVGFTRATVQIVERGQPGRSVAFPANIVRDLFQIIGAEALGDPIFMNKLKVGIEHNEKEEEEKKERVDKEQEEMIKKVQENQENMKKVQEQEHTDVSSISIKRTPWKVKNRTLRKFPCIPYKTKVVKVGGVLMAQNFYSSDDSASDATQFSTNDFTIDDYASGSSEDYDSDGYIHKEYDRDMLCLRELPSVDTSEAKLSEEYNSGDVYIRKEYDSDTLCLPSGDSDGYVNKEYDSNTFYLREVPSVDASKVKFLNNFSARRRKSQVRKVRASNVQWWKQVRAGITEEDMEAENTRRDERLRTRESDDLLDKAFPGGAKLAHALVKRWEEEDEEKQKQKEDKIRHHIVP